MIHNLENLTTLELMQLDAAILDELQRRGAIRTKNALGDYAERLVADTLGLKLETNSTASYDAVDSVGIKYQIKSRKPTVSNPSLQLGALRDLETQKFDFLIAIIFNPDFSVKQAVKIPHAIIASYAKYMKRPNAHRLILKGAILRDKLTEDITHLFLPNGN